MTAKPTSASLAGYPNLVKVRTSVGSKDVRGVNGVRPRCQVRVGRLAVPGGAALYGPATWSGVVLKVI